MMLPLFLHTARLVLYLERLWQALVLPYLVLAGVLVSGALGLWQPLPYKLHLTLLAVLALALVLAVRRVWQNIPAYPTVAEGRAVLERRRQLRHRPLTLLADVPATELDAETTALWQKARQQAAREARFAGLVRPQTLRMGFDRWGLRYPLFIGLVLVVTIHPQQALTNLHNTLLPSAKGPVMALIQRTTLWIQPPAYTQQPAFLFDVAQHSPTQHPPVPQQSTAKVEVQVRAPLDEVPTLSWGGKTLPTVRQGLTYAATLPLVDNGTLTVTADGYTLLKAALTIRPDAPPTVALNGDLKRTPEGMLNIPYTAADDYGLKSLFAVAQLGDHTARRELVLPDVGAQSATESAFADFTADPMAGLAAKFWLEVTDVGGQTASTKPFLLQLPARTFTHPVAQALVQLRRDIFAQPTPVEPYLQRLHTIMSAPEKFGQNLRAYLSLTLAYQALEDARPDAVNRTLGLLWDAALIIDKGPLAIQMERLMSAQKALQQALARHAGSDEIQALYQQLAQAMHDLLGQVKFGNPMAEQMGLPSLQNKDLEAMLQRIQDLLKSGATGAAQQALKELEQMMAHMQMGDSPASKELQAALGNVGQVVKGQQQLIEKAFQNKVPGRLDLKQRLQQQQLAEKLGRSAQQLERMGFATDQLKEAAQAMQKAYQYSATPGLESLVNALQNRALQLLQQGQQQLAGQLRQQMGYSGMGGFKRDPSGRLHAGDDKAKMPEDAPQTLTRKIRDELIDRADDLGRPAEEQRYLQRLMQPF